MTAKAGGLLTNADDWFTPKRFAVILAALVFVTFPLVLTGLETFYFRDFGAFGYPLAFYHKESFWRGEVPLWNPLNTCGIPFLAQWNTLTLYPLSLFYLIFPLSWSLGVFELGHLFLGGMGMYFLAHRWNGNRFAAAIAGAIFAFNGLTWQALMWPNNSVALGWMPWVLLTAERARTSTAKWGCMRAVVTAAIVGAMQMLSGAPEVIFLTWVAAGTFWLVDLARGEKSRWPMALQFLCVVVLVAGLTAAQLLPFLDLLKHSQRDTGFAGSGWAMPVSGWANFIVPLFQTVREGQLFLHHDQYWTASYYLGIGTVAFAVLALLQARDWRTWTLAGLASFGLFMAWGEAGGLYLLLKRVLPVLGFMRFPIKFVALTTFVIPLLAAKAIAAFQSLPTKEWNAARTKWIRLGGLVLVAIALIVAWQWRVAGPENDRVAVLENAMVRAVFLILIVGGFVALRRIEEEKLRVLLRVGLILLFWLDIASHMPNLSPTVDRSVYEPDSIRSFFKWDKELNPGESRANETQKGIDWVMFHRVADPATDVNGRRISLFANYNLLDHAAKLDGEYSLDLQHMSELGLKMNGTTNELAKLNDFLGVARITNPAKPVDWLERKTFLPMITTGQEPVMGADNEVLQALLRPDFEPAQTVYLEPAAQGHITAHRAQAKVVSWDFKPQKVIAEVEAGAPAMMVVAQAFYHDWQAYVDGKPVKLWRANHAFQALQIPEGRHQVSLVYEDAAFKWGCVISLASIVSAAVLWIRFGRRNPIPL